MGTGVERCFHSLITLLDRTATAMCPSLTRITLSSCMCVGKRWAEQDTQSGEKQGYSRQNGQSLCPHHLLPPPLRWSVMLAGGIPAGKRLHDPFTHVWLMWGLEQILPPQTKILEELSNGELVTVLCRRDDMPNLSTLQRWRRDDEGFDDRC